MLKEIFGLKKEDKKENVDEVMKILDLQLSKISMEIEQLKNLASKVENIEKKMEVLEEYLKDRGVDITPKPLTDKTKEAIKMILKKHGALNAHQVAKLLNLSRSRCAEYLKQMEEEGILSSEWRSRKKYYFLRQ